MATKEWYIDIDNPSDEERRAMRTLMRELFGDDDDDDDGLFVHQAREEHEHKPVGRHTRNSKSTDHGISTLLNIHSKHLTTPTRSQHKSTRKGAAMKLKAPRGKKYEYINVLENDDHPTARRGGADGLDFLSSDEGPYTEEDSTFKFVQRGADKLATPGRIGATAMERVTRVRNDPIVFSLGDSTTSGALNTIKHHRPRKTHTGEHKPQTAKAKDTTKGTTSPHIASPVQKAGTITRASQTAPTDKKRRNPPPASPRTPKRRRTTTTVLLNTDATPVQIREDKELRLYEAVERLISPSVRLQGRMFGDEVFNLSVRHRDEGRGDVDAMVREGGEDSVKEGLKEGLGGREISWVGSRVGHLVGHQVGRGRKDSGVELEGSGDGRQPVGGDIVPGWEDGHDRMMHGSGKTGGEMSARWDVEGRADGAGNLRDGGEGSLMDDNAAAAILFEMRFDLRGDMDV